jgi:hypothetical protein
MRPQRYFPFPLISTPFIDRRSYRNKYDARKSPEVFSEKLRVETNRIPSLTLTRTRYPAMVCKIENIKPFVYAGFARVCNAQQPPTAHS